MAIYEGKFLLKLLFYNKFSQLSKKSLFHHWIIRILFHQHPLFKYFIGLKDTDLNQNWHHKNHSLHPFQDELIKIIPKNTLYSTFKNKDDIFKGGKIGKTRLLNVLKSKTEHYFIEERVTKSRRIRTVWQNLILVYDVIKSWRAHLCP